MARKKTAQDLAIDLAFDKGDKPKKKRGTARSLGKICDISSAQSIIKKFAMLKSDVDRATIGAFASSQSVASGRPFGGPKRRKAKRAAPPTAKKSRKKRARKAA